MASIELRRCLERLTTALAVSGACGTIILMRLSPPATGAMRPPPPPPSDALVAQQRDAEIVFEDMRQSVLAVSELENLDAVRVAAGSCNFYGSAAAIYIQTGALFSGEVVIQIATPLGHGTATFASGTTQPAFVSGFNKAFAFLSVQATPSTVNDQRVRLLTLQASSGAAISGFALSGGGPHGSGMPFFDEPFGGTGARFVKDRGANSTRSWALEQ